MREFYKKFLILLSIFILILGCERDFDRVNRIEMITRFQTTDLHGEIVSEEIFSNARISTLTVFSTKSEPSLNLLRKLDSTNLCLLANFRDDFDRKIPTRARVLIASDDFADLLKTIKIVPITFFIDSNGKIIGQPVIGDNFDLINRELERLLSE